MNQEAQQLRDHRIDAAMRHHALIQHLENVIATVEDSLRPGAVTMLKELVESLHKPTAITVIVEGGSVIGIWGSKPDISYDILDLDNDPVPEEREIDREAYLTEQMGKDQTYMIY